MRADDVRLDNTEPECSVLRHHLVDLRDGVLPEMLAEYYRLRGWDVEGRPTQQKLAGLGLL